MDFSPQKTLQGTLPTLFKKKPPMSRGTGGVKREFYFHLVSILFECSIICTIIFFSESRGYPGNCRPLFVVDFLPLYNKTKHSHTHPSVILFSKITDCSSKALWYPVSPLRTKHTTCLNSLLLLLPLLSAQLVP